MPFNYKSGNSFLHKMPCWCKIVFIPLLNFFVFKMPFYVSAVFLVLQFFVALALHFTLREQFKDFSPVIFYAVVLYFTGLLGRFFAEFFSADKLHSAYNFLWCLKSATAITFKNSQTAIMLLKLFCIMQSASLVFKTSTSLQILEGVGAIESAVRKVLPISKKNLITSTVSLFICFIPMVFKNWNQCRRAWFARGGKGGVKMLRQIFPVFFSVGIKQAYNSSRAISAREVTSL